MDFLHSHNSAIYTAGVLAIAWIIIYILLRTRRNRQWLIYSSLLGAGIGPLLGQLLNPNLMDDYTILSGNWTLLEIGIVSGLFWGIAASLPIAIKLLKPASLPLRIMWLRVILLYLGIWLAHAIASQFTIPSIIVLIGFVGFTGLILSAWDQKLILHSALNSLLFFIMVVGTSIGLSFLEHNTAEYHLLNLPIVSILNIQAITLVTILALSAPIIMRWWLNQPLKPASDT